MSNTTQPITSLYFDTKTPATWRNPEFDIITPPDRIPPWQIIRPQNVHGLSDITVEAIYPSTMTVVDIMALRDPAFPMQIVTLTDGTDVLIWPHDESLPFIADLDGGRFYVKVSDTVNTWYSQYMMSVQCGSALVPPGYSDIAGQIPDLEQEIRTV